MQFFLHFISKKTVVTPPTMPHSTTAYTIMKTDGMIMIMVAAKTKGGWIRERGMMGK